MSSDIVLTSALRNNLLSLQNTQRLIDDTQLRLATGLKVNSALDNPQNFFTAQALNNRASDLTRLLDGISQSIRTVETANSGVTALTGLVEQADSIVNSARDLLASSEGEAIATGNVDVSDFTNLVADAGFTDGDQFTISTVDDSGLEITETITVNTGDTGESLAAKISNAFADNQNGEITARVTDSGFFEIKSADGRSFRVEDADPGGANTTTLAEFQALGLSAFFADEDDGAGGDAVAAATITAGNTITSRQIFENDGDLIEAGDLITGTYQDTDGTNIVDGLIAGDTIAFAVNSTGATTATYTVAAGDTFQDVIDAINSSTAVNDLIEASFDPNNGQISIRAISGDTDSVEITVTSATAGTPTFNVGFGSESANFDALAGIAAGESQDRTYSFSTGSSQLESLADNYNEIRNQIDDLVKDASYRGVNLLQGDDLVTNFNENRTSTLTTEGIDFTANGLGLGETTFGNSASVEQAASDVRNALASVRSFGTTLANDLNVITSRRDFTENTINTLESGADDLTVADQNEEGANLLALQTRQALGTTALSLASQSAQSVLRLF